TVETLSESWGFLRFKRDILWISRCTATARERIRRGIANDVTGMSECSQQRGNLKDNGYIIYLLIPFKKQIVYLVVLNN
ncbi:hypothetical protein LG003_22985, partial [Photorhabdus kleinii]|uniref:hypothetical protein n=1 Tax=Photorhabdus kleinii TaxID=768034 RepID=UPI0021D4D213